MLLIWPIMGWKWLFFAVPISNYHGSNMKWPNVISKWGFVEMKDSQWKSPKANETWIAVSH